MRMYIYAGEHSVPAVVPDKTSQHILVSTYTNTHNISTYTNIHTHIHTYIHTYTCVCTYMQASTSYRQLYQIKRIIINFSALTQIYTHTSTHTHIHTYTYMCIFIYIYAGEHSVQAVVPDETNQHLLLGTYTQPGDSSFLLTY